MRLADGMRRLRSEVHERLGFGRSVHRRLDGTRALLLCYHRVIPAEIAERDAVEEGIFVTPESFVAHLDWLEAEFRVLPLHEITRTLESGSSLPAGACAITFDDGWRDNLDYALPALEERGLPATMFVVADRVGTQGAFWPDEVCRRFALVEPGERWVLASDLGARSRGDPLAATIHHLKQLSEIAREEPIARLRALTPEPPFRGRELLDWDEVERVARGGTEIESHGATHAILTHLDSAGRDSELHRARAVLRERGYGRHDLLAYPSGAFDQALCWSARQAGYRAGFTLEPGLALAGQEAMALPRITVHAGIARSRAEMFFQLGRLT